MKSILNWKHWKVCLSFVIGLVSWKVFLEMLIRMETLWQQLTDLLTLFVFNIPFLLIFLQYLNLTGRKFGVVLLLLMMIMYFVALTCLVSKIIQRDTTCIITTLSM